VGLQERKIRKKERASPRSQQSQGPFVWFFKDFSMSQKQLTSCGIELGKNAEHGQLGGEFGPKKRGKQTE